MGWERGLGLSPWECCELFPHIFCDLVFMPKWITRHQGEQVCAQHCARPRVVRLRLPSSFLKEPAVFGGP